MQSLAWQLMSEQDYDDYIQQRGIKQMHYLSHYVEQKQTELFTATGAFFAFSNEQFAEQKQDNIEYASCGAGLIAPKDKALDLIKGLRNIHIEGIAADIAENGKAAIIQRELGNHEAQITGDISGTIDALEGYGITADEVQAGYSIFYKACIDNDWF